MKTVYCLYRVSTKGQVDKNDIPMQKQSCREFAEHQPGWVIKKEFQEKGVSVFKVSANDRDAVQELKTAAENKEFRRCYNLNEYERQRRIAENTKKLYPPIW